MIRHLTAFSLIAVALSLSACGKKKVELQAPPATARPETPAATTGNSNAGETTPGVASSILPGSQDDLRAQAGSDTVLFGYDSYEIDADARATLVRQAAWLKKYPAVRVTLEGHCDERGTREYNLALGDRRANSAKNFLAGQGIDIARLTTISYGKERPVAAGDDEAANAQNRRAVTVVMSR